MILGQLIQTGRRFCECRPSDFIPESDHRLVVIAYSIDDRFLASSFESHQPTLLADIQDWINASQAIAYIIVQRMSGDRQDEFPAPIGRDHMDRITLTAATAEGYASWDFLCERLSELGACRLAPAGHEPPKHPAARRNLFHYEPATLPQPESSAEADELLYAS